MSTSFIQKGTSIIKQAIIKDNERDYEKALELYSMGVQYLMTGLKYEKNQKVVDAIKSKVTKFVNRANKIKSMQDNGTVTELDPPSKSSKQQVQFKQDHNYYDIPPKTEKLVLGFCRKHEKNLKFKCIPPEIANIFIKYYYISAVEIISNSTVKWDDIVGLNKAKQLTKECIVLPLKFPQLFVGSRRPHTSVLFYGPSGCGKTYLTYALASETDSKLLYIHTKEFLIQYIRDGAMSEKMLKNCFETARQNQPCTICIDGIELFGIKSTENWIWKAPYYGSNASLRRLKTELLIQISNFRTNANYSTQIIALCNEPWNLDPSLRRRFGKRIYFKLPDTKCRKDLFDKYLDNIEHDVSDDDYTRLLEQTDGLSYYEICCVLEKVCMNDKTEESISLKLRLEIAKLTQPSTTKTTLEKFKSWHQDFGPEE